MATAATISGNPRARWLAALNRLAPSYRRDDQQWLWPRADGGWRFAIRSDGDWQTGTVTGIDDLPDAFDTGGIRETVLCLPGDRITLAAVDIGERERRWIRRTLAYKLEENLVDDAEQLQIVPVTIGPERVSAAVVDDKRLQQWLEPLGAAGIRVDRALPDYLAMPRPNDGITLYADATLLRVRSGDDSGFAIGAGLAAQAIDGLFGGDGNDNNYCPVTLYSSDDITGRRIAALLPEGIDVERHVTGLDCGEWLATGDPGSNTHCNLLQNRHNPGIPWRRHWYRWRWPLTALAAALLLNGGVNIAALYQQKAEAARLDDAMISVFHQAFPHQRVIDAERQLRAAVRTLDTTSPGAFTGMLRAVSTLLDNDNSVQVSALRYDGQQHRLLLDLTGNSFGAVDRIRQQATAAGLHAELITSHARTGGISARLAFTEGP